MEKKYVAAIDQGTTGTRFMIFNHSGQAVSSAYREHHQIYPQAGWVEHDPLEIWVGTQEVIGDALEKGHVDPREISAVGVTNQRETAVIWEKATGQPIGNAIVWQCTRTREICQELLDQGLEEMIRNKTGLVIATYFSGPKIKWILDNLGFSQNLKLVEQKG
ncbi:glycerol kinase [Candidatus Hakubella thermalkaliphila]|nr:glycerol kinase [Candidatus Hakubella thermalkaliphila]